MPEDSTPIATGAAGPLRIGRRAAERLLYDLRRRHAVAEAERRLEHSIEALDGAELADALRREATAAMGVPGTAIGVFRIAGSA